MWEVNGAVCSATSFKGYTNVNLWRGAELAERADPGRLLLGEGAKMRHVRLANPTRSSLMRWRAWSVGGGPEPPFGRSDARRSRRARN